jgi:hypothetical protein
MRLLILSIIAGLTLLAMAFDASKCEHVFTIVVQPEIKKRHYILEGEMNPIGVIHNGKEEGIEIICVKCFHRQKQILNYPKLAGFDCDTIKRISNLRFIRGYSGGDTIYKK